MRALILMGSPRKNGNTAALLVPFCLELERQGWEHEIVWLYDKTIDPCTACRTCQGDWSGFGCVIRDDACGLFDRMAASDLLVLATPIYSWYCTPPMKALLDRFVYGMNKYYGAEKGPALWAGKKVASVVTCGYPPEKGADLWESGIKRYCRHSRLSYLGMLVEHDKGYHSAFMDGKKELHAATFAKQICQLCVKSDFTLTSSPEGNNLKGKK